ncbi:MAG: hypothetical protein FK730_13480 [Asgard group archaeon]|nr:hypothetical protein [Asgard group archaeon]
MVVNFKHSDSLGYIITNWFNELKILHENFLVSYNELIDICQNKFNPLVIESQKNFGKESRGVLNVKYNEILLLLSNNSINFLELNELLLDYKQHLLAMKNYALDYQSIKKLDLFFNNEINTVQTLKIMIRNIIKAGALVFKKKSSRKNEDNYINQLKNYNRYMNNLLKEKPIREENIRIYLDELTNEVEKTQIEEIAKEKAEREAQL